MLLFYVIRNKSFLNSNQHSLLTSVGNDIEENANRNVGKFLQDYLAKFFIYLLFIDAFGLALDIAIWSDGRDESDGILFWKVYEMITDFFIVFILDPIQFLIFLHTSYNFNVNTATRMFV